MPAPDYRDPAGWLVRRAGLARTTTFAGVVGLVLAALIGARPVAALAGLTLALLGAVGGVLLKSRFDGGRGGKPLLVVVSVVMVGLFGGYLGGSARVLALIESALASHVGSRLEAELVVTGQVRSSHGWQSATAEVRGPIARGGVPEASSVASAARGETVLLEIAPVERGTGVVLSQGLVVEFEGKILAPKGPSSSGFDQASYLRHQGISVVLGAGSAGITPVGRRGGVSGWFDRLRASAQEHLGRGPEPQLNEVLQGVVMGDTEGIDDGWSEAFRRAGTAHMFSVSGLHVASIAALMIGLARLVRASRGVGFLLAAVAALLMIPFVGPSPPLVRAAVMIIVVLAGTWTGRKKDRWQVLGLAALVVLGLNPFAISDAGFQLSFAALAGIFAFTSPLQKAMKRLPRAVGSNLAVSAAASLGTAPVSLLVFDRTSLVAPVANLLVVPLLPVITGLGMAAVFTGFLWSGFSTAFDALASVPLAWTVEVCRLFAIAPVLDAGDIGRALLAAVAGAAAIPIGMALTGRAVRTPLGLPLPFYRRSVGWLYLHRPRSRHRGAAAGIAIVIGCAVLGGAAYPPLLRGLENVAAHAPGNAWPDGVEVRVLDVGQGDAVLVRTSGHRALLFDGGPAGCDLARQLHTLGVRTLDLVVVSHPHADHFAGLLEALDELEVRTFVDGTTAVPRAPLASGPSASSTAGGESTAARGSAGAKEAGDYLTLRKLIADRGGRYFQASSGSSITVDGVSVRFFAPSRPLLIADGPDPWIGGTGPPSGEELNGSSLVALLSFGEVDVLLPGDAEADVLGRYAIPPVEIFVVPHHGSKGSVTAEILEELEVEAVCISVGKGNSFGHPDPATLSVLVETLESVLRTDQVGWVSYRLTGGQAVLRTEREPDR